MSYANINGYLSKPIYLMRGLHQGSPLSPILFLMIAQVFSNKLKISHDITGFAIQGIDILLSLFADNTDIFLQDIFLQDPVLVLLTSLILLFIIYCGDANEIKLKGKLLLVHARKGVWDLYCG